MDEIECKLAEGRWASNIKAMSTGLYRFAESADPTRRGAYCAADEVAQGVNFRMLAGMLMAFDPDAPHKIATVDRPGIITVGWMQSMSRLAQQMITRQSIVQPLGSWN